MVAVKENVLCLFGGVVSHEENFKSHNVQLSNELYILDINEGYWSVPSMGGYIPSPRAFFAMTTNSSQDSNQLLVLGGKTQDKLEDTHLYVLTEIDSQLNEAWSVVDEREKKIEQEAINKYTSAARRLGQNI